MSRQQARSPLPILWASQLISMLPMAVIALVTDPWKGGHPPVAVVVGACALLPAAASVGVGRLVLRGLPPSTAWIVRWALAEAVTVLGLAVSFLGGSVPLVAGVTGLGFLLLLVQYPREGAAG